MTLSASRYKVRGRRQVLGARRQLFSRLTSCPNYTTKPRIVGGEPVPSPRETYPYFAVVFVNDQTGQTYSFTPSHVTLPPFGPHIIMRPALDAS